MSSSKSQVVAIRLKNETIEKIKKALRAPRNSHESVGDYCQKNIERWVWRHEKRGE